MSLMNRGQFTKAFFEDALPFVDHFFTQQMQRPAQWKKFYRIMKSNRSVEQVTGYTGVGLYREIGEGEAVTYDRPVQNFDKTFRHKKYGLGIKVTQEMVEDDQWGIVSKNATALGRSERESMEVLHAAPFNDAFSGSTYTTPDAQPLCSASHVIPKTLETQSNLATAADLDVESLRLALIQYRRMKDDTGLKVHLPKPRLVISPENVFVASEIVHSRMRPDTSNNVDNALKYAEDGLPEIVQWDYLTDTDAWFLIAPPSPETEILSYWRKQPYSKEWVDDPTDTGHVKRQFRMSLGFAHYLGVVGNAGA